VCVCVRRKLNISITQQERIGLEEHLTELHTYALLFSHFWKPTYDIKHAQEQGKRLCHCFHTRCHRVVCC